jgi:hypothetical protein
MAKAGLLEVQSPAIKSVDPPAGRMLPVARHAWTWYPGRATSVARSIAW